MNIAIMGANSYLAKDLILSLSKDGQHHMHLFGRCPELLKQWLDEVKLFGSQTCSDYSEFPQQSFDAILNFVGVGDPRRAITMGASIFDITVQYDELAISYIKQHPKCKYVFLSSGAVYGGTFEAPASVDTVSRIPVNHLLPSDWYGAAKLLAECRHRALNQFAIVDLRVFNYFSCTADIQAQFLITEMLRAISVGDVFETSSSSLVRDYLGPNDFAQMIRCIVESEPINTPIDCYTKKPVEKIEMLEAFKVKFGLEYRLIEASTGLNATGIKKNYYSTNYIANKIFGYVPQNTALEVVLQQAECFFI
jgi:nucleoside-diphosphate-sugar epimerase